MIRFFTTHPTAANLMMAFGILLGLVTLPELNRETFPEIKSYTMQVNVAYPGASATDIEASVCAILEDGTAGVRYVKDKTCEAREGLAILKLKMMGEGDFSEFKDEVSSAIDAINDLPDDSSEPVVTELGKTAPVITLAITGPDNELMLYQLARDIKDELQRNPAIPQVNLQGFSERQLRIEVNPQQLQALNLSINQLGGIIRNQNKNLPLGVIETSGQQVSVKVSPFDNAVGASVQTFEDMVILSGKNGSGDAATEILLGDIATITDGFKNSDSRILLNGKPAAYLNISKTSLDDSLDVLAGLQTYIYDKKAVLPEQVQLSLVNDTTSIVKDRIEMIVKNGWQGLILVLLVMALFFSFRYSFWVAMGLPVSFLMGFYMMSLMGMSINMISMVALLIAIGILMDDAIVISESVAKEIDHKRNECGTEHLSQYDIIDATVQGVKKVGRGILSSFATTVLVFGGATMIEGDIGQILKVLPIVLISVVAVSLIEAFLILPNHLAHSIPSAPPKPNKFKRLIEGGFSKLATGVGKMSAFSVRQPYLVVAIAIALFFTSISMLAGGVLKFQAFPTLEGDVVENRIQMPQGTTQARTLEVINQSLAALELVNKKYSNGEPLVQDITIKFSQNGDAYEAGNHLATISVDLVSEREVRVIDITNQWLENINTAGGIPDAVSLLFKEPAIGPAGKAVEIELIGNNLTNLSAASNVIQRQLNSIVGVKNVQDDLNPGKAEIQLTMKAGAYSLGVDANMLASQLRTAYEGSSIDQVQKDGETVDVTLWYPSSARNSLADLEEALIIHDQTGDVIALEHIAKLQWINSWSRILRDNGQRTIKVLADIDTDLTSVSQVSGELNNIDGGSLVLIAKEYPEIKMNAGGESESSKESMGSLAKGFLFGLLGVYVLLSVQFKNYSEPLLIMSVIPLALIGAIFGHLVMGLNFSMPSAMGFVSLSGIVVNNSILLSEYIRFRLENGESWKAAAAGAANDRFRAIFITTVTTLAGMLPLMFETSLQAQVLIPLVVSLTFGLAASAMMVMFVVPALYSIRADIRGEK
jgi:hydrophobic/amphiphilic exporter-1 (mainly G- bacteria), HAE1 family